jgi:hypothetical protein
MSWTTNRTSCSEGKHGPTLGLEHYVQSGCSQSAPMFSPELRETGRDDTRVIVMLKLWVQQRGYGWWMEKVNWTSLQHCMCWHPLLWTRVLGIGRQRWHHWMSQIDGRIETRNQLTSMDLKVLVLYNSNYVVESKKSHKGHNVIV